MASKSVIIELFRSKEDDLRAVKEICSAFIYRAYSIRFEKSAYPPDTWIITFRNCNLSYTDSIVQRCTTIMALYGCKHKITVSDE